MSRCAFCHQGWVFVQTRPFGSDAVEEYGPCPYCDLGDRHNESHFGNEFWTRPERKGLRLHPWDTGEKPLPLEENRRRLKELFGALNLSREEVV